MSYTAPSFKSAATSTTSAGNTPNSGYASNFGGLRVDANRVAMTGTLGNYIQTIDGAGSPASSPLTVNTTQTLVVPKNAAQCTIVSTTNPVTVSEDSTSTASFSLPAAVPWTFDCANLANIYLKTGSSTVVNFYFNMI